MSLYHLTASGSHEGTLANLYHLTSQKTLEGQLAAFLLTCKVGGLQPSTIAYYRYQIGRFVNFCRELEIEEPSGLSAAAVRLFINHLQQSNGPQSIHDYYRAIKRFCNWMMEEEVLAKSPMPPHPPRVPHKVIQPFTPQHIADLLTVCPPARFTGARNRALLLVFLDTGLRLAEMAGIKLIDVDVDREIIKVMGKGARERIVRIGKKAQLALFRYVALRTDNLPCLWVSEGRTPLTSWGIQAVFRVLGKRAGIENVRCSPHTCRHTFGTSALRNKADIREVQTALGHSTLKMTLRYVATVSSEDAVRSHRKWSPVDNMGLR